MKKLKKFMSAILAGMLSVSLLGSLVVKAETADTESPPVFVVLQKKIYIHYQNYSK